MEYKKDTLSEKWEIQNDNLSDFFKKALTSGKKGWAASKSQLFSGQRIYQINYCKKGSRLLESFVCRVRWLGYRNDSTRVDKEAIFWGVSQRQFVFSPPLLLWIFLYLKWDTSHFTLALIISFSWEPSRWKLFLFFSFLRQKSNIFMLFFWCLFLL